MSKLIIAKNAYTFDDIQIIPIYSEIQHRADCSMRSKITKTFSIQTPILSAPMQTVTGVKMLKTLFDNGANGVQHRFCDKLEQSKQVMLLRQIIDENKYKNKFNYTPPIISSIGIGDEQKLRAELLVDSGADILLIDVAHGDTKDVREMITWCKNNLNTISGNKVEIIAGNVCTYHGAANLIEWGVDAIRVGIGGGAVCETRIRTGIGVPQFTAIDECVEAVDDSKTDVCVIADGGIKTPGDVAKALSLGCHTVMVGSLFAGTEEAPGDIFIQSDFPTYKKYKKYSGSASADAKNELKNSVQYVEGNATLIPYRGSVVDIISQIKDGVLSSMSYCGAETLSQFKENSQYCIVTQNGVTEARAHLLK
ncbi:GuaB IMP dehydrogenase/GMP reductase [Microcystis phage Mel-JY01]